MRKSLPFLVLAGTLIPPLGSAQSLEEFEQWKKQYMGEYAQYREQIDKEFSDFLKQQWEPFDTEEGVVRDEAPKPPEIPVAKVKPQPKPKPVAPIKPAPIAKPDPITRPVPHSVVD